MAVRKKKKAPVLELRKSTGTRRFSAHQQHKIEVHIQNHRSGTPRLCDLAQALNISRFHFARRYRATYGEPLRKTLLRRKIEQAAKHLREHPRTSLTALAHELGFHDSSHFSRTFRSFMGAPPCDYRGRPGSRASRT